MPDFIPGLELSRLFFEDVVKGLLHKHIPRIKYAAALIGDGSEVLGFDNEMSTDHDWGPRLMLFLSKEDHKQFAQPIINILSQNLPFAFKGYSTNWSEPDEEGVQQLVEISGGLVNHRVEVFTVKEFINAYLGVNSSKEISSLDWLTLPQHRLRAFTAGGVFHDDVGDLTKMRKKFDHYPSNVRRYMLASQWRRISQDEHLMGRAGTAGDELGSRIIATRLVRDIMIMGFLMEKTYAPYSKWFGTAFKQLVCAPVLGPTLGKVLIAKNWEERDDLLGSAYEILAEMHNNAGITKEVPAKTTDFYGRPFHVIFGDNFADAIKGTITDKKLKGLPLIGSVDQFSDSTDVLEYPAVYRKAKGMYED